MFGKKEHVLLLLLSANNLLCTSRSLLLFPFIVPFVVPFVVPQRGVRPVIIMLAISLIIGTTICYAHAFPFVAPFVVPFVIRFNSGQCSFNEHGICMLIRVALTIKAEEILHVKRLSSLCLLAKNLRSIGSL